MAGGRPEHVAALDRDAQSSARPGPVRVRDDELGLVPVPGRCTGVLHPQPPLRVITGVVVTPVPRLDLARPSAATPADVRNQSAPPRPPTSDTSRDGTRRRGSRRCLEPRARPRAKAEGPVTTPRDALVAVLASADPGERLTWTQLEELADAALAAGWTSPAATAAAAPPAAPLPNGSRSRLSGPAAPDTRITLRAPHADSITWQAARDVSINHSPADGKPARIWVWAPTQAGQIDPPAVVHPWPACRRGRSSNNPRRIPSTGTAAY